MKFALVLILLSVPAFAAEPTIPEQIKESLGSRMLNGNTILRSGVTKSKGVIRRGPHECSAEITFDGAKVKVDYKDAGSDEAGRPSNIKIESEVTDVDVKNNGRKIRLKLANKGDIEFILDGEGRIDAVKLQRKRARDHMCGDAGYMDRYADKDNKDQDEMDPNAVLLKEAIKGQKIYHGKGKKSGSEDVKESAKDVKLGAGGGN